MSEKAADKTAEKKADKADPGAPAELPASKPLTEKDLPEDLSTWDVAREIGHVYVKLSEDGKFFTVVTEDGEDREVENIKAEEFNAKYEVVPPAKQA